MDPVLASTLSGHSVMTTDGAEIGTLENVTVDLETGRLEHLRVDPSGPVDGGYERTAEGTLLVPAGAVTARNDYLLVEPARS